MDRDGEEEPDRPYRGVDGDVVVPTRMYKAVTVFSTVIAVVLVVAGFLVLDAATRSAQAPAEEVNVVLAVVGVAVIAFGGGVYAFSTRFRTAEMGNPKDEAD